MTSPYMDKAANINLRNALKSMLERQCLIDFGIVKKVLTRGVLQVEISAAKNSRDVKIITCVMANMASYSCSIEFVPNEGDKVLVFYPARTHEDMFDVEQEEVIVSPDTVGYNRLCGIAVLMNQFRVDNHKNFIQFDNGEINLKTSYADGDNHVILNTKNSGKMHLNNDKAFFDVEADGEIKAHNDKAFLDVENSGNIKVNNDKVTVEVKNDGNIMVTNENSILTVDPEGNYKLDTMDAKSCIMNNLANLHDIIKETLHILNTTYMTISGIPCFPNQLIKQETDIDNLME